MSGPGDGCADPRDVHMHWCGFCGAVQHFSVLQCRTLVVVPSCPRCHSMDWRDEIDELMAPDFRELPETSA